MLFRIRNAAVAKEQYGNVADMTIFISYHYYHHYLHLLRLLSFCYIGTMALGLVVEIVH